jgi:voltage-dependent anion channel protein 2
MGKAVTAFKDIGKACSDLLTKDYKVGKNTVEVKAKTPNGVTFTPSGTLSDGKFAGSLVSKYGFGSGVDGEVTVNTTGVISCQLEAADLITKGLVMTLNADTPAAGKAGIFSAAKCTVDYKAEMFNCKTSYDYFKGDLSAALSTAYMGMTLGCSADYSTAKGALAKYAAACQYVTPDFSVMAKLAETVGKGQTYTGSYYHKVSGDMQVGGEVSKASGKSEVGLAFGCAYKLDKDTSVKGKVDSDGILYGSYKQKVSALTTMTLAAQVDTVNLSDNKHKLGMILNLTP